MLKKLAVAVVVVISAAACESGGPSGPVACTAIFAFGLSVQVQDSVTGLPLSSSDGVVVTAQEGSYQETLQAFDGVHFAGAGERAGTYTVRVTKTGYLTWERTGVVVTKDECHVHGVSLTARLQH